MKHVSRSRRSRDGIQEPTPGEAHNYLGASQTTRVYVFQKYLSSGGSVFDPSIPVAVKFSLSARVAPAGAAEREAKKRPASLVRKRGPMKDEPAGTPHAHSFCEAGRGCRGLQINSVWQKIAPL